jgi:hypothetical protein
MVAYTSRLDFGMLFAASFPVKTAVGDPPGEKPQ